MNSGRTILFLNEFFHPDLCASAAVLTDRLPRLARLRPRDRLVVLAGNRAWDDPRRVYPARGEFGGLEVLRIERPPLERRSLWRRAWGFAAFQRGAVRVARRLGPVDLVIGTTAPPQGGEIARRIARQHRCPYLYTVLDLYPDVVVTLGRLRDGGFLHRRWLARDTRAMREAAAVVCIAERMTRRVRETRRVSPDRVHTLHDGFDPARLACDGPNEFRRRHNPDGRFIVQYAGNMGLSHPFETILAAARLLAADRRIGFQFVGDGPRRAGIQANLPANATWIPYQPAERLGQVLATADVGLISQHSTMYDQALPYKIYALLAAGKPCLFVGDRRSELVEWLESSGAGRHVNQGEPERLAQAIQSLAESPAVVAAMSAAAREFFLLRFHADHTAAAWSVLIDRVLDEHRGPSAG